MARKHVGIVDFTVACNIANSAEEVAAKFGIDVSRVRNRAKTAKKSGVSIKTFDAPKVSRKLDVAEINRQVAEINRQLAGFTESVTLTKEDVGELKL